MSTATPLASSTASVRRPSGLGSTFHRLVQRATSSLYAKRQYAAADALSHELESLPADRRGEAALAWYARQSKVL